MKSSVDIALPDGAGDDEYLAAIADALGAVRAFGPDLVLYDAGVDVHRDDVLGRLAVTDGGICRREMMVLDTLVAHGVPVAGLVGGGYDDDMTLLVGRHVELHRAAQEVWAEHGMGEPLPLRLQGVRSDEVPMPVGSWEEVEGWRGCNLFGESD